MQNISGRPDKDELAAINQFTKKELSDDEVYVFSVVLCDNEIDRDHERFSDEALEELAKLFVGVTGISDHDPKVCNQSARIFSCRTEEVGGRMTSDGRTYRRLCARAYLPRSEKNNDLILALDSGIRKEVSVGCAVKNRTCSICGEDISVCQHIRGKEYGKRQCFATLSGVTDAYEWSFVAVPAQKSAGVIKGYKEDSEAILRKTIRNEKSGGVNMDVEKKLFSGGEQQFSAGELQELAEKFRSLQKSAADGEMYRTKLLKEIRGLSAVVLPELTTETVVKMADCLSVRQLDELKNAFEHKAGDVLPISPQLYKSDKRLAADNKNYQNI